MCKLMLVAGLNPNDNKKIWTFVGIMNDLMTKGNDDGCGYTAVDEKGNIFGEKWLFNEEAFKQRKERFTKPIKMDKKKLEELKKEFGELADIIPEEDIPSLEKYGTFGVPNPKITAMTFHTRAASGTVCYDNIHPFVDKDKSVSVVHNGFINNHDKTKDQIRSTCDSERILNQYLEHDIGKVPADIQNLIDNLKGWFACGIFSKDKDDRRVLDIFRTKAPLGMAFVEELNTFVYATDIDDIKRACRQLGWTITNKARSINEDKFFRLDAITGKPLVSIKYADTTLRGDNHYETGSRYWERHETAADYNKRWEEAARKRREEREAIESARNQQSDTGTKEDKTTALTLVPDTDRRYTESELNEIAEFRKAGFTEEEIRDAFEKRNVEKVVEVEHREVTDYRELEIQRIIDELGWSREAATVFIDNQIKSAATVKEIAEAKKIIKDVTDRLNENEGANEGYFLDRQQGLWIKRKHGKH